MAARRGRGALDNPHNRYAQWQREAEDDGWGSLDLPTPPLRTTATPEQARSILSFNGSPDLPFDRSINAYRGCEHGCIYCYARPSHARYDLSPGLDFESRLFYKPNAAVRLRAALARPGYEPAPLALGVNTDAYQPLERRLGLTRQLLEVLAEHRHPLALITKSALIERDLDLLASMAQSGLAEVAISLTTLDRDLARRLEPRASSPERRLQTIARLAQSGIPVSVMVAPVIPVLTDGELETLLGRAREAGAADAGYVMLRLPQELRGMFGEWLQEHRPGQAEHVLARLRDLHGEGLYDARFGRRMRGQGVFADLIRQRFRSAYRKLGFSELPPLDCSQFQPPGGRQLQLL